MRTRKQILSILLAATVAVVPIQASVFAGEISPEEIAAQQAAEQAAAEEAARQAAEQAAAEEAARQAAEQAAAEEAARQAEEQAAAEEAARQAAEQAAAEEAARQAAEQAAAEETARQAAEQAAAEEAARQAADQAAAEEAERRVSEAEQAAQKAVEDYEKQRAEQEDAQAKEQGDAPKDKQEAGKELKAVITKLPLYGVENVSLKMEVSITGGKAPYQVSAEGKTYTVKDSGAVTLDVMPAGRGTAYVLKVTVTDADGRSTQAEKPLPVSSAVKENKEDWDEALLPLPLTGSWQQDISTIALTQLGYQESKDNFIVTNSGVTEGYTRYGDLLGIPYGEWSAPFVVFCARYAKISSGRIPDIGDCEKLAEALRPLDQDGVEGYEPQTGDLIFFDMNGDAVIDHTGIIAAGGELQISVIEGDADGSVQRRSYDRKDPRITGYVDVQALQGEKEDETESGSERPESYQTTAGGMEFTVIPEDPSAVPEGALLTVDLVSDEETAHEAEEKLKEAGDGSMAVRNAVSIRIRFTDETGGILDVPTKLHVTVKT